MGSIDQNLKLAKEAAKIKLEDLTGMLTIEDALKQAQKNLNRLQGIHQIIKVVRGENND